MPGATTRLRAVLAAYRRFDTFQLGTDFRAWMYRYVLNTVLNYNRSARRDPTVGVDPQSRNRIWQMLEELRSQGASLLLTTHQLDEAQRVCDRIVIIDHGKTIAAGTFAELLHQTVGSGRRVVLTLDSPAPDTLREGGFEAGDENSLSREVTDIAAELPKMIEEVRATGAVIRDIHVEAPSLQAVFIHLTGRELRE